MRALLSLMCLASACSLAAGSLLLGLGDQATPPYKLGDATLPATRPGVAVELLQRAAANCDISMRIKLLPGARMLKELESGDLDAAGMLSYTAERAAYAAYPLQNGKPNEAQRLATLSYVLYARQGHRLLWDGNTLQGLTRKVGTNLGWSINLDLERLGIPAEPVSSVEQNFMKLQAGRIDAYATHEPLGDSYLSRHDGLNLVKLQPPLVAKPYYLIFSRSYAARNPALASCLWRQVGTLRDKLYQQRMHDYLD